MTYVSYNSQAEINALDLNTVNGDKSIVFPNHLYGGNPFPQSQYVCESGPRNSEYDYLFPLERTSHPDYFTRFGTAYFPNGYGVGHWNGRYKSPPCCINEDEEQPPNMAPERFYKKPEFTSPFYSDGPTYLTSREARYLR